MFTSISQFEKEWAEETARTQRLFDALTDESLKQEVAPGHRSLGGLAWHIVTQLHETLAQAGLAFDSPGGDDDMPASAAAIASAYRKTSHDMLQAVRSQWTDATLQETRTVFGQSWVNGQTLRTVIQHEVHHRAQMTVLMRQAGLRVPDVYGPAKETWAEMGIPAPRL